MVEQVRFFIAGKGALKTVVFEGFIWGPRDIVRFLGFPLLTGDIHLDGVEPKRKQAGLYF